MPIAAGQYWFPLTISRFGVSCTDVAASCLCPFLLSTDSLLASLSAVEAQRVISELQGLLNDVTSCLDVRASLLVIHTPLSQDIDAAHALLSWALSSLQQLWGMNSSDAATAPGVRTLWLFRTLPSLVWMWWCLYYTLTTSCSLDDCGLVCSAVSPFPIPITVLEAFAKTADKVLAAARSQACKEEPAVHVNTCPLPN